MREAALCYAKKGWPVFPLVPKGKKPITSNGLHDATTNPIEIERWWSRTPDANIGVVAGPATKFWVLDIDGPEGCRSLTELEGELGCLPETLDQQTGGGGRHLFFAWPAGREIRNKQSLRPGIDVRGAGGYCVLPPSVHASGKRYDWPTGDKGLIAAAPKEWLDFVCPVVAPVAPWARTTPPPTRAPIRLHGGAIEARAAKYLAECDPAVQGSGGHNALLWAARALVVGFCLSDSVAISLLWSNFNPLCTPPWDESNVGDRRDFERKVSEARSTPGKKRSGWLLDELGLRDVTEALRQAAAGQRSATLLLAKNVERAKTNPAEISLDDKRGPVEPVDRRPFPIDRFPDQVTEFVQSVSDSHCVDMSFAALPALAVAAAAMGNVWRIKLKGGYIRPPTIWVGLVSASGTNKSGPLGQVLAPLRAKIPMRDDIMSKNLANPQGGRFVVSDATLEAVVSCMNDNPRGLIMFRDELAGWIKGFNAYKKGGDEQAWLEFWGAKEYTVDRKTGDERHISIPSASCCVLGGIQPKILLECFDPARFASGLVPRMLVACPPRTSMFWSDAEVNPDSEEGWADAITWLRTRPFAGLDANQGKYTPHVLVLTPEARAAYKATYDELELEQLSVDDDNCAAMISKAKGLTGRMALIHHGLTLACAPVKEDDISRTMIGLESIEAGADWARWCLEEQIRLYGFGAHGYKINQANYLVERIRAKHGSKPVSANQVHKLNSRKYPNKAAQFAAMEKIVELGLARWEDGTKRAVVLL